MRIKILQNNAVAVYDRVALKFREISSNSFGASSALGILSINFTLIAALLTWRRNFVLKSHLSKYACGGAKIV